MSMSSEVQLGIRRVQSTSLFFIALQCQVKYNSVYDEYDILEEIGVGAFGVVHRAVEKKTGRSFAAKFVPIHHASERCGWGCAWGCGCLFIFLCVSVCLCV